MTVCISFYDGHNLRRRRRSAKDIQILNEPAEVDFGAGGCRRGIGIKSSRAVDLM